MHGGPLVAGLVIKTLSTPQNRFRTRAQVPKQCKAAPQLRAVPGGGAEQPLARTTNLRVRNVSLPLPMRPAECSAYALPLDVHAPCAAVSAGKRTSWRSNRRPCRITYCLATTGCLASRYARCRAAGRPTALCMSYRDLVYDVRWRAQNRWTLRRVPWRSSTRVASSR